MASRRTAEETSIPILGPDCHDTRKARKERRAARRLPIDYRRLIVKGVTDFVGSLEEARVDNKIVYLRVFERDPDKQLISMLSDYGELIRPVSKFVKEKDSDTWVYLVDIEATTMKDDELYIVKMSYLCGWPLCGAGWQLEIVQNDLELEIADTSCQWWQ